MMMIMSQCEIVSGKDETKMKSPLLYRISYKSSHSQIYCISLRQHLKYTKYRLFVLVVVCCLLFVSMEGGNQQLSCGVRKVNEAWLVIDGFLPSGNFIKARSPLHIMCVDTFALTPSLGTFVYTHLTLCFDIYDFAYYHWLWEQKLHLWLERTQNGLYLQQKQKGIKIDRNSSKE